MTAMWGQKTSFSTAKIPHSTNYKKILSCPYGVTVALLCARTKLLYIKPG